MHLHHKDKFAFSLVELSIVLVILGLLVGGVLAGQSLIHAAELRAVTTEFTRYSTAARAFRDKYFQNPGDMTNATSFWGSMSNCSSNGFPSGTGTQTCNGSGDGGIGIGDMAYTFNNESLLFRQHLSNAGLIEGKYTGLSSSGLWNDPTPSFGVNAPPSKFGKNAGWEAYPLVASPACCGAVVRSYTIASSQFIEGDYGNILMLGTNISGVSYWGNGTVMTPQDAWNIDNKMDDSKPGSGSIVTEEDWPTCYLLSDGSVGSASTTASRSNIQYNLNSTTTSCNLIFRNAY